MDLQEDKGPELSGREGKRAWYVIHTYSGYENKVKANLERKVASQGMEDEIFNVIVPLEDETEIKDGKEKVVKRKVFPGYVLVEMIVNNRSWYVVRNTQGVTGFVGSEKEPIPLTEAEAKRILEPLAENIKVPLPDVKEGQMVRIKSGLFEDYSATVTAVDRAAERIKVLVEGKPFDLALADVEVVH